MEPQKIVEVPTPPRECVEMVDRRRLFCPDYDYLELRRQCSQVLKTLTPREERVLIMRFGIGDGKDQTLDEIAADFGVTRERIRQIESKAMRKLRYPTRSRRLRMFVTDAEPPKERWCGRCGKQISPYDEFCEGEKCWSDNKRDRRGPSHTTQPYFLSSYQIDRLVKRWEWFKRCRDAMATWPSWQARPSWLPAKLPRNVRDMDAWKKKRDQWLVGYEKRRLAQEKAAREQYDRDIERMRRERHREERRQSALERFPYDFTVEVNGKIMFQTRVSDEWIAAVRAGYLPALWKGKPLDALEDPRPPLAWQ